MFVLLGWRVHADQKHLHGKQHSSRHGNQQWRVRSGLRIFSCFAWRFRPPRSSVNNGIPPHVQETSPFLNWSQWACNLLSGQFCFLESHAVGWCTVLYDIIPVHTSYSTVYSKIMINMHLIFWLQLCKSIHAHKMIENIIAGTHCWPQRVILVISCGIVNYLRVNWLRCSLFTLS